jgi:hypothetical protein
LGSRNHQQASRPYTQPGRCHGGKLLKGPRPGQLPRPLHPIDFHLVEFIFVHMHTFNYEIMHKIYKGFDSSLKR